MCWKFKNMYTQNTILKSWGKKVMPTKSVWGSLVLLIKDSFVVRIYGAFLFSPFCLGSTVWKWVMLWLYWSFPPGRSPALVVIMIKGMWLGMWQCQRFQSCSWERQTLPQIPECFIARIGHITFSHHKDWDNYYIWLTRLFERQDWGEGWGAGYTKWLKCFSVIQKGSI